MPKKFRILLVDDDSFLCDLLERASKENFPEAVFIPAICYLDAITYIEGLESYGPSLILLDFDLKGKETGLDFITFLRSKENTRLLPVVMLTVNSSVELIFKSYQMGATSYTVKPFTFSEWGVYLSELRKYWFNTATLPQIRFNKRN